MRVGQLIKALKNFPKDQHVVIGLPDMSYSHVSYGFESANLNFDDGVKRKALLIRVLKQEPAPAPVDPKKLKFKEIENGRSSGNEPGEETGIAAGGANDTADVQSEAVLLRDSGIPEQSAP